MHISSVTETHHDEAPKVITDAIPKVHPVFKLTREEINAITKIACARGGTEEKQAKVWDYINMSAARMGLVEWRM